MGLVRSVVFAIMAALTLPTAGLAVEKTTKWFTIDILPADNGSPPLFLTSTSQGIRLERYRSGDPSQQWAYVHFDYPTAPRVTGGWELTGQLDCADAKCPFTVGTPSPRKFVNRASGACLAFRKEGSQERVLTVPCSSQDQEIRRQIWLWFYQDGDLGPDGPPRGTYTPLWAFHGNNIRCLEAGFKAKPNAQSSDLVPGSCANPPPWYQSYRFLLATSIACKVDFDFQLCFAQ
ncbi:MAG TPA: hypothetical protein VJL84_11235 [Kiloniellales bacterium]|nr:hypothetical protein [Kiloniellales bacterium]